MTTKLPEIGCPYIAPDECTGFTPASCCERIQNFDDDNNKSDGDKDEDTDAGVVVMTSMALLLVLSALAVVL